MAHALSGNRTCACFYAARQGGNKKVSGTSLLPAGKNRNVPLTLYVSYSDDGLMS